MIGNAVPVKLAEYVANAINDYVVNKDSVKEVSKQDEQIDMFEFEVVNI